MTSDVPERSRWLRWHDDYDDPQSSLSWRLNVVRQRLTQALDEAPAGPLRVLSLCAGQGRDVVPVVAGHRRRADVAATLVELDADNVAHAVRLAHEHDLASVDVRCADAGHARSSEDAVPADVLLLCGIFGNISDADVERTVRNSSRLCAPGATVLWTRHRGAPDLTVDIRRWFDEAGFAEVGFDSSDLAAVGVHRLAGDPLRYDADLRLFTFVD